jgi:hypothetical protein
MIDKDGNCIPCDTHATMYKPSGDIKGEWNDTKEWGIHHILDQIIFLFMVISFNYQRRYINPQREGYIPFGLKQTQLITATFLHN